MPSGERQPVSREERNKKILRGVAGGLAFVVVGSVVGGYIGDKIAESTHPHTPNIFELTPGTNSLYLSPEALPNWAVDPTITENHPSDDNQFFVSLPPYSIRVIEGGSGLSRINDRDKSLKDAHATIYVLVNTTPFTVQEQFLNADVERWYEVDYFETPKDIFSQQNAKNLQLAVTAIIRNRAESQEVKKMYNGNYHQTLVVADKTFQSNQPLSEWGRWVSIH